MWQVLFDVGALLLSVIGIGFSAVLVLALLTLKGDFS
jgi:hypothetical protein